MPVSTEWSPETPMVEDEEELFPKFSLDERVFCPDEGNGDLYEAVIRKTRIKDDTRSYLVHFSGWNARQDRWVPESSVVASGEEVRLTVEQQEQKEEMLRMKQANDRKRKKRSEDGRGKRRFDEPTWKDYCDLPFTLKTILVEDREHIMRMGFDSPYGYDCMIEPGKWKPARRVHNLPSSVTVRTLLNHFVKFKKKEGKSPEEQDAAERKARRFVERLSRLFEDALPVYLLYNPERAQYLAICSDPKQKLLPKSEIYGCEFLLRLFVRLPILLEESGPKDGGSRREMGEQIADLIVLLQKNRMSCFKAKYREPKYEELNDWEKSLKDGAAPIAMEDY